MVIVVVVAVVMVAPHLVYRMFTRSRCLTCILFFSFFVLFGGKKHEREKESYAKRKKFNSWYCLHSKAKFRSSGRVGRVGGPSRAPPSWSKNEGKLGYSEQKQGTNNLHNRALQAHHDDIYPPDYLPTAPPCFK